MVAPATSGFDRTSTWSFVTSEGFEFDALAFAFGKGSFYIVDSRDPDAIQHEILYVGLGLTKSKGPIPFGIGGSFSTPDMWSAGIGNIKFSGRKSSLELSDFGGLGVIGCGAAGAGAFPDAVNPTAHSIGDGVGLEVIWFGGILNPKAMGMMASKQKLPPGVGGTLLPCIFTIDP